MNPNELPAQVGSNDGLGPDDARLLGQARLAGFSVEPNGSITDGVEVSQRLNEELSAFASALAAAERERWTALLLEFPGCGDMHGMTEWVASVREAIGPNVELSGQGGATNV